MAAARRMGKSVEVATTGISRQRVQLDFRQDAFDRLKRLKEVSDASSNSEVVRRALQLYEVVLAKQAEGYTIQLKKADAVVELPLLV